jgi:hypothetical protein
LNYRRQAECLTVKKARYVFTLESELSEIKTHLVFLGCYATVTDISKTVDHPTWPETQFPGKFLVKLF